METTELKEAEKIKKKRKEKKRRAHRFLFGVSELARRRLGVEGRLERLLASRRRMGRAARLLWKSKKKLSIDWGKRSDWIN